MAVVTNIAADHLGLKDINTLEELAHVKSVVPRSVRREGTAILNADDELVMAMRKQCDCRIALFSLDENNRLMGSTANWAGWRPSTRTAITIARANGSCGSKAVNVPLTYGGKAVFNIRTSCPRCWPPTCAG